jgi:hypothetical protein
MKRSRWWRKHQALLALCVLFLLFVAALWIVSILGLFPYSWSTILSALFTVLGVIFALLQLYMQRTLATTSPSFQASSSPQQLTSRISFGGSSKRKGTLLVLVKKRYLGSTMYLCRGFIETPATPVRAANVVERWIDGSPLFVALFPAVEPGNYTVYWDRQGHGAFITVDAGQTAEIDWRYWEPREGGR